MITRGESKDEKLARGLNDGNNLRKDKVRENTNPPPENPFPPLYTQPQAPLTGL